MSSKLYKKDELPFLIKKTAETDHGHIHSTYEG